MKALLDHILEKKQKLSTDVVIKIMDPTTTTYDMVGVLCDYINAFKLVENKADLAAFCDLSKTLEDVKNKNKLLSDKYNQCISEILDAKSKEIAIEYYELLEHCLGSLEQVKSKGWSRTEPAPIF